MLDRMVALGIINLLDIEEMGSDPLVKELEMTRELAERIVTVAIDEAKRIAAEDAIRKAAEDEAKKQQVSPLDAALSASASPLEGSPLRSPLEPAQQKNPELSPLAALEAAPAPPAPVTTGTEAPGNG
jgi:hypothetical protein